MSANENLVTTASEDAAQKRLSLLKTLFEKTRASKITWSREQYGFEAVVGNNGFRLTANKSEITLVVSRNVGWNWDSSMLFGCPKIYNEDNFTSEEGRLYRLWEEVSSLYEAEDAESIINELDSL